VSDSPPLIAIEGVDGSGKSTVVEALVTRLHDRGHAVATYDFPDYEEPQFGPLIARFLRGGLGPMEVAEPWFVGMLFAGNRAEVSSRLRADLAADRVVVCDRFSYSNVAFQASKLGAAEDSGAFGDWLARLEFETFGVPRPDVSFWLRVPLEQRPGLHVDRSDRDYLDGAIDIHEADEALQRRVHDAYEQLARDRSDIETIDLAPGGALLSPFEVCDELIGRLEKLRLLPVRSQASG
jgi:dTMP kinase